VSAAGVSIVRGSHVEGPFPIAEGARDESIERAVSSLGETGEQAVNVVADETTPAAFMGSLLGALNGTDLLVTLADGRSGEAALEELEADVAEPATEIPEETSEEVLDVP
jgi:hypothetical protein